MAKYPLIKNLGLPALQPAVNLYAYENFRYDLLKFWHFCCEFEPTTWQHALTEYVWPGKSLPRGAMWWRALPPSEKRAMRKLLASDMLALEQKPGLKYRAPRGHGQAQIRGMA